MKCSRKIDNRLWVAALILIFTSCCCCSSGQDDTSPLEIELALAVDTTSDTSAIGKAVLTGAEYAARAALPDFKIHIKKFDDHNTRELAIENAIAIAADKRIVAVIGHASSGMTREAEEVYGRFGVPLVMPVATDPAISVHAYTTAKWKNTFRLVPINDAQARAIVGTIESHFTSATPSAIKVLLAHDTSPYGIDLGHKLLSELRASNMDTPYDIEVAPGKAETNYNDMIVRPVKDYGISAVVFVGYYQEASLLVHQLRAANLGVPVYLTDGAFQAELFNKMGPSYNDVFITFVAPRWEKVGGTAASFVAAVNLGSDASYAPFAADAVNMIVQALQSRKRGELKNQTVTPTRRTVLAALRSQKSYAGFGGQYTFNEWGDTSNGRVYVYRLSSGQKSFSPCDPPGCR